MRQVRPPMASWRPRHAARAAVALRHERPNASHRRRYYAHLWPDLARRDLFEHPGPWIVVWSSVGLLGLAATVASTLLGDDARVVGVLNLGVLTLLLLVHGVNAVRVRRRRSVLLAPVLAVAVAVAAGAAQTLDGVGLRWLDILTVVFLVWIPIAAANLVAPRRTYLAPITPPNADRANPRSDGGRAEPPGEPVGEPSQSGTVGQNGRYPLSGE